LPVAGVVSKLLLLYKRQLLPETTKPLHSVDGDGGGDAIKGGGGGDGGLLETSFKYIMTCDAYSVYASVIEFRGSEE